MNKLLAMILCLAIPLTVFAGDNGYKSHMTAGQYPMQKRGVE
jgi:hypothetical protein